jgi:hypothetical protein
MTRTRKRVALIAAGWLLCHSFALAAPLAAAAIAATEDLCTCPGGTPGAVCPMHHRVMGAMTHDSAPSGPRLRNACAQPDYTLLAFAVGFGILPHSASIALDAAHTPVRTFKSAILARTDIPDAPPPRA